MTVYLPRTNTTKKIVAAACLAALTGPSFADRTEVIEVKPGASEDAYFEVNFSGAVYAKIGAKPGEEACANFWWIKWPFGNIEQLGRHCNFAKFDIPGVTHLAISSKLRVGGAKNNIKVGISATEAVAHSISFDF